MPQVKPTSTYFPVKVKKALKEGLEVAGIKGEINSEKVRGTNLYRFLVVSRAFEEVRPSERQDLIWRIIDQNFTKEDQLRISMVLALSPKEMKGN